jgi:L-malate glycosyltransferase
MAVPVERLDYSKFCFPDFDIIHTNGIRPDMFAFLNRKKIKYHISTIHNFVFDDLFFTYNSLISWLFGNIWLVIWRKADKLVCVSQTMKSYYSKWFPSSKLEVIYNGIAEPDKTILPDYNIIQAINNFHRRGLTVLGTAGILTKIKGVDQILDLLGSEKNLALVVIGDGKELPGLMNYAKKMKFSDRCLFCGFRNNAVNLFKSFDLFVMPSRSEGFGISLIEAVQQKIPVVCSDIEVFKELFNSEEVTFFKLNDKEHLRSSLRSAIETGKSKVDYANSRYKNEYTSLIMAEKYFKLYLSV